MLWLALSPGEPTFVALESRSASAFADSVGVNVHTTYDDTSYARAAEIRARLRELGVRHVRDGLILGRPDEIAALRRLRAQGQRATLIIGGPAAVAMRLLKGPLRDVVGAIEGPNELDNDVRRDWAALLRRYMPIVRAERDRPPRLAVPLLGPSLVDTDHRLDIAPAGRAWDVTNLHPYPGGRPPESRIAGQLASARRDEGGKPVVVTESGYHTALRAGRGQPPVSEQAAAVYLPRLLLEDFRLGIARTFVYELADEKPDSGLLDPERHFGLLRQDLSPKPAFDAIRRLLASARATGPPARAVPDVETDAQDRGVRVVSLRRADGSRLLAFWRPVAVWSLAQREPVAATPVSVRLTFSRRPRETVLSRPSIGAALRAHPQRQLSLPVGADVTLVAYR